MIKVSGVLQVILSMAANPVEIMFSELLSIFASIGQIILFLGLGCASVFVVWAMLAKRKKAVHNRWASYVSVNMCCLLFVRWC